MNVQSIITLNLTSGELDVLASIVRDRGRRESRQAALIWRLRREYRKVCRAAGITPSNQLLFNAPADKVVMPDELAREYDTLGDILAAVQDARCAPKECCAC